MNKISRKLAHNFPELESARQHQENWPTIMQRAVEGGKFHEDSAHTKSKATKGENGFTPVQAVRVLGDASARNDLGGVR